MKYFVVESSSVTLVASMLISPLMGPILAGIFGAVVGDTKLRNLGLVNELISLVICVLSGESDNWRNYWNHIMKLWRQDL